ncbi:DUF5701 family protein [Actinoplanes aureus]|jgi:hypothetical protein|uniref:Uncharacterized protein n=1 Tax=Actinoplanes aureus TaxID=2792083 RepID=A0A931CBN4_9ACTN|nr:DUF5701 family protein [Actinoplanes aureus]MBG0565007.1 hypothetical protein [Actinoplanes aureus]
MTDFDPRTEFDRQLHNLLELGYPAQLREQLADLRELAVRAGDTAPDPDAGRVPFLLVVTRAVAPIEEMMPRTTLAGKKKPGFVDRLFEPGSLERFVTTPAAALPGHDGYLLFGVERGEEFCGVVPNDAMDVIAGRERTLLTIEEGIALITHFPQILVKNKCFSLGGSRSTDRRVPAIWISQLAPKLGWCWAGNPHTWLGMASATGRAAG